MSWRVVVVSRRCKLEYKLGYFVCRGEEVKKVYLAEIGVLIVELTAVSMTAALLCELMKNKIDVVFCDEKHNPQSQLLAFAGRHDASGCLRRQIGWAEEVKASVWARIVQLKIGRQCRFLQEVDHPQAKLLEGYVQQVLPGDASNREGHAAKVYFNALFGMSFKRGDENFLNGALNYGYAVLLSAFNREVVANGYNMQLGLAHKNEFNPFNLSCDLMEPFRVLVDRFVFASGRELTPDYKHALCDILNQKVRVGQETCTVSAAIGAYCRSVFDVLEGGTQAIKCYEL